MKEENLYDGEFLPPKRPTDLPWPREIPKDQVEYVWGANDCRNLTPAVRGGETIARKALKESLKDSNWVATFEKPQTSCTSIKPSTTALSPYLSWGCLSPREVWTALDEAISKATTNGRSKPPVSLHGQMLWRDFNNLMAHDANRESPGCWNKIDGNKYCRNVPWDDDPQLLEAWKKGQTGFPWIDATMRQLRQEGWIHHLGRHAVACFLTRGDLWQSWEEGAKHFEAELLDADYALNGFNWLWLSCSGFFYQYFRCYSPITFQMKNDPNGNYIRKFVPELRNVPSKYIYCPWEAPSGVLEKAGVNLEANEAAVKAAGTEEQPEHETVTSPVINGKTTETVTKGPDTTASAIDCPKTSEIRNNMRSPPSSKTTTFSDVSVMDGKTDHGGGVLTVTSKGAITTTDNTSSAGVSLKVITSSPTINTGNDRVTVDIPKGPLVSKGTVVAGRSESSKATMSNVPIVTKTATSQSMGEPKKSDQTKSLPSVPIMKASNDSAVGSGKAQMPSMVFNPYNGPLSAIHKNAPSQQNLPTSKLVNPSSVESRDAPVRSPGSFVASQPKPTSATASSYKSAAAPNEFTNQHSSLISEREESIRRQRAPLSDRYPPYIINSDTSLEDARKRLRIALDQTRQLRAAFTNQVYSKYRVCLKPPPQTEEIVETLKKDPKGMYKKLQVEMKRTKAEKDLEKKDSQKVTNETDATEKSEINNPSSDDKPSTNFSSTPNAESGEPLMYITSGLSLIVLPESNALDIDMSMYNERGPIDPATGQRVRGISAAAATAGEGILERARRGQALRAERERKQSREQPDNFNVLPLPHLHFDSHYWKRPSVAHPETASSPTVPQRTSSTLSPQLSPKPSPLTNDSQNTVTGKLPGTKKLATAGNPSKSNAVHSAASAKAIRARVQATMSMNTLLSLNPIHEELRNDTKYSASTLAMMESCVETQITHTIQYHKNTPNRFKHPFPNSLGGRRKATGSTVGDGTISHFALPSIPTLKEQRQQQRIFLPTRSKAATPRAKLAMQRTLRQFDESFPQISAQGSGPPSKKRRITEIEFLCGFSDSNVIVAEPNQTILRDSMHPTLVLNVMKAVGLVTLSPVAAYPKETSHNQETRVSSLFDQVKMKENGIVVESGPLFDSLEILRDLESRFSTPLPLSSEIQDKDKNSNAGAQERGTLRSTVMSERPVIETVCLRGGGGEAASTAGKGQEPQQTASHPETSSNGKSSILPPSLAAGSLSALSGAGLQNQSMATSTGGYQNVLWDDRSQQPLVLLQNPMMSNTTGGSQGRNGQQQLLPEHYHQTNAFQLAHQLRVSMLPNSSLPTAGDLSDYIGGLHPQQAAYDWSSAAAAVASSHSLAALGLNQHRHTMVPLTVQDHTRALMAREHRSFVAHAAAAQRQQQAVVMMGGATNGAHPYVTPGYPHLATHLLNHSGAAFMGQNGMQQMSLQTGTTGQPSSNVPTQQMQSTPAETLPSVENGPGSAKELDKLVPGTEKMYEMVPKRDQDTANSNDTGKKRKSPILLSDTEVQNKRNRPTTTSNKDSQPTPVKGSSEHPVPHGMDSSTSSDANHTKAVPGLTFFAPPTPDDISTEVAANVMEGRCHEVMSKSFVAMPGEEGYRLIDYIISVGFSVPIPKVMVMHRLKDRMNHPLFKTGGAGCLPPSSRDVIAAVIMIWLWQNNEDFFQRAFAKSGRIDVDPDCKWFVDAAVNKAVSALSEQVTQELSSRAPNSLVSAIILHKSKNIPGKGVQGSDLENLRASAAKVDILASRCVSMALNTSFSLNDDVDRLLPTFHDRISYLDEVRKCALYCKSQERTLLASIISRKATMSFSFSHSYVSAMVRAGEALGHGSLFEVVQNEKYNVSTMIPYDVFTDESYAWEDPCRPAVGFTESLTGDEMMRRAHARAMIQKSLKKLQERHNIKGGTPIAGPYIDQGALSTSSSTARAGSSTPRGSSQRRRSFSDAFVHQGSGAAAATSTSLYDPKHTCPPLEWKTDDVDNSPYGRHNKSTKTRSLSLAQGAAVMRISGRGGKGLRGQNSAQQNLTQNEQTAISSEKECDVKGSRKSTREIPWKDVAGIFQQVQLQGTLREKQEVENKKISVKERTIFAPVVRKLSSPPTLTVSVDESSDDEDISDGAVLARHQVVLNDMKEKLTAFQTSRKKAQDRRKSRDKSQK
ncbi:photolyase [Nitzschia inconspicua]|nr:photolyase [Nitzschia inconspicua]